MGAGAPDQKFGTSELQLDPAIKDKLFAALPGLQQATQAVTQGATQNASQFGTDFNQHAANLNTNFNPNAELDQFSKGILAQGEQTINNRQATNNAQILQQFRGNPAVARILQAQGAQQSQMAQNPLLFQTAIQQRSRQLGEFQANNQAQLLQQDARSNAQNQTNAALTAKTTLQGVPAQAQQGLMAVLGGLGQLTGKQVSYETGKGPGGAGGGQGAPPIAGAPASGLKPDGVSVKDWQNRTGRRY